MINKINAVPDKKVNERGEYIGADFLLKIHIYLFPVFQLKHATENSLQQTHNNCKKNRKKYKSYQLMIDSPLHQIQPMYAYAHHMRHEQAHYKIERKSGNKKVVK
jgi:hypothetical protein